MSFSSYGPQSLVESMLPAISCFALSSIHHDRRLGGMSLFPGQALPSSCSSFSSVKSSVESGLCAFHEHCWWWSHNECKHGKCIGLLLLKDIVLIGWRNPWGARIFWRRGGGAFARGGHAWVFSFFVLPQPPDISDFCQPSGESWLVSWGLWAKTALLKNC